MTMAARAELTVLTPPAEAESLRAAMVEDPHKVVGIFAQLDAREAVAHVPADRAVIFDAIERSVGFDEMNARVRAPVSPPGLTQWRWSFCAAWTRGRWASRT
jgi:hypothetical protein